MELKRDFFKAGNVYRSEGGRFEGEFLYHTDRYIHFKQLKGYLSYSKDDDGSVPFLWDCQKRYNWTLIKEKEKTYTAKEVHEKFQLWLNSRMDFDTFLNEEFPLPKEDTKLTELKKKYAELGAEIDKLENE